MKLVIHLLIPLVLLSAPTAFGYMKPVSLDGAEARVHAVGEMKTLPDFTDNYQLLEELQVAMTNRNGSVELFSIAIDENTPEYLIHNFCHLISDGHFPRRIGWKLGDPSRKPGHFIKLVRGRYSDALSFEIVGRDQVDVWLKDLACGK